ncbi:hypothetical protein C8R45DRAFT_1101683 [Mycena sanguinolenta]|nr:hypothetical protein C8R45DRAFT_1101683 [Mycena sanguinolenta]
MASRGARVQSEVTDGETAKTGDPLQPLSRVSSSGSTRYDSVPGFAALPSQGSRRQIQARPWSPHQLPCIFVPACTFNEVAPARLTTSAARFDIAARISARTQPAARFPRAVPRLPRHPAPRSTPALRTLLCTPLSTPRPRGCLPEIPATTAAVVPAGTLLTIWGSPPHGRPVTPCSKRRGLALSTTSVPTNVLLGNGALNAIASSPSAHPAPHSARLPSWTPPHLYTTACLTKPRHVRPTTAALDCPACFMPAVQHADVSAPALDTTALSLD